MHHEEADGENYIDEKDEWLPYVKNDVLCTAFCHARYSKAMERITEFGMKDCLSLPGLGWKNFNSLRTEDEPIYTYNDKCMRHILRQCIKRGCVCTFNQYYKSKNCDVILKIISEELKVKGKIYDIIEAYWNYKNKHFKIYGKEYENQFRDYRHENEEKKENYINENLSLLPIHQLIKQIKLDKLLWGYDGNSLYPSAMWVSASL